MATRVSSGRGGTIASGSSLPWSGSGAAELAALVAVSSGSAAAEWELAKTNKAKPAEAQGRTTG